MILKVIAHLLQSCWGFSFALRHGVSLFGGIQHPPVKGCSAASCNFGVLTGEDEQTSFYSAILCQMQSQKQQNDLCSFPRQPIQYYNNPSLSPTGNAEEAEVEWSSEDLQDLLELTPKKKKKMSFSL